MKKILFTLAMLISVAYGQSTLYLRGDSVMLQKTNGNSELIILNGSRTVTNGILTNIGNGRTRFLPIDSFSVGGTLNNIGSGYDLAVEGTSSVKSLSASNGITADSATEGQVGVKLGGTLTAETTIEGVNYPINFNWPSLAGNTGMRLRAQTTAAAGDTSRVLSVVASGANAIGSRTTAAGYFENTHTGAGISGTKSFGLDVLVGDTSTSNGKNNTYAVGMRIKSMGNAASTDYPGALMVQKDQPYTNSAVDNASAIYAKLTGNPTTKGALWVQNTAVGTEVSGTVFNSAIRGTTSGVTGYHNVGLYAAATNGRKNFAIIAADGFSSFNTTGDTTHAIVGIGAGQTEDIASLNIQEKTDTTGLLVNLRDGDFFHYNDSIYAKAGGVLYNITHAFESPDANLQTWQETLDEGSTLNKANTINQADFLITWLGPNRWYDSTATQVSIRDFNSGIDYLTYTPILGDTVINSTQDVVNGIKMYATDGSETHYIQVKGNGIYAGGLVFNDGAALRGIAIDTTTGKFYTVPLGGSSSTPGIDDVLAVGQSLTASRSVDLDGESVSFSDGFNTTSIGATTFSSQYTASGFTHSTTLTNYEDYFQALTANQGSTRSVLIETNKDWYGKIGVIAPGGTSYLRVDSTQVEINTSNFKLTGRVFNDAASLRSLVIDTTTGYVYTAPISSGGSSVSFGTDNQIPYTNSDGDDFDYSANLTFDGQSMVVTNTNAAFSTNYILTIAGEEGNDAAMLRLKGAGNRSAYIGLGASDHMIFKNNHATSATAGFSFMNRLGASVASFTNTVAHLPFGVIVNEAGGDFDFRVESDGDTHNIFSDGGTNQVGIGTSTLTEKLTVNGNIAASGGKVGASLDNDVTPVSTTGSSEENLITYALPAGKLATDGDYLEVSASFLVQTVSDKIYLKFGSTNVVEWTAGNIGTYMVHGTITRTGAATQEARFMIVGEDTGVSITSPTETLSSGITIAGAAEVGGSSATQYNLNVKYYPAN